jgi:hypothetical protein
MLLLISKDSKKVKLDAVGEHRSKYYQEKVKVHVVM